MEDNRQNQLVTLTPEQEKFEREKKSLNRRFGFVLAIAVVLLAILVFEIVNLFIG